MPKAVFCFLVFLDAGGTGAVLATAAGTLEHIEINEVDHTDLRAHVY